MNIPSGMKPPHQYEDDYLADWKREPTRREKVVALMRCALSRLQGSRRRSTIATREYSQPSASTGGCSLQRNEF